MHLGRLLLGALLATVSRALGAPVDNHAHTLDSNNFAEKTSTGTWIVKHYSPSCHYCKMFQPKWDQIVTGRALALASRNVHFGEIDCLANERLCEQNKVEAWPTVVVFKAGERQKDLVGDITEQQLKELVDLEERQLTTQRKYAANSVILGQGNYTEHANRGIWLVKHYSPFCLHCRRMAPEWKRMTDEMAEDMAAEGITFAEVNCIDNRRLCDNNHVDGYPTINLFVDGKFIEEMLLRYEYRPMKDYVLKLPKRIRSGELVAAPEPKVVNDNRDWDEIGADNGPAEAHGSNPHDANTEARVIDTAAPAPAVEAVASGSADNGVVYNPSGQVVVLTNDNFTKGTAEGPWFVKFYAPWCPHCQTLAPVWRQVAEELKGRVNVGEVNCDENGKLCSDHNVQGFPTLQLLWEGEPSVFKGSRDLDNMVNFVDTMLAQPREIKTAEELQQLKSENDVAFMFAYDKADTSARTKAALEHVKTNVRKLFLSKQLGIVADASVARAVVPDMQQSLPVLMAFKDGRTMTYTGTITGDDQLREWLYAERFPLLPEFTRENADSLFYDSDYLVLGIVDSSSGREQADDYRSNVRAAAMEYQRLTSQAQGGVAKQASVRFAWLNGGEWESYIGRVFRIERKQLPAVVIVQPSEDHFFTLNARGQPIEPTRAGVLAAVRAAVDGKLQAQSTKSFLARGVRSLVAKTVAIWSFFFGTLLRAAVSLVAIAALVYYMVRRRPASRRTSSFTIVKGD
ncbi:hypothetical protein H4R20_002503 [Coemansia guatemalensis]|uniref:Thioredoxin domain-containing protein n=1 Tax=Coemansia guatemalensis TaxID=2761395 RepID=A0A9W8HXP2_9FUNG|nr:hypothetical protein H4R20_002503 [Coemansia guatemalensis]